MKFKYERLDENGNIQRCPINDYDGKITGQIVMGVTDWFNENPRERIARGWIKHWYYEDIKEIKESVTWDPATEYLQPTSVFISEYEIKDVFYAIPKTEETMRLEEMLEIMNIYVPSGAMILDSQGGAIV